MEARALDPRHDDGRGLLVAMPLLHLEPARERCESQGTAVLPAGGPGDLDEVPTGSRVLLIATDAGDAEIPAATWTARFEGRVAHASGEPFPAGIPETWVEEHGDPDEGPIPTSDPPQTTDEGDEFDDDEFDDDDEDAVGPQSFFRVSGLSPLPRAEWVFANELVPKQQRRGRSFIPRTPRLIEVPD